MSPIVRAVRPRLVPVLAWLFAAGLVPSCTSSEAVGQDAGMDAAARPGLFEDCSPGPMEVPCQDGLRCSLTLVGDSPYQGWLTQCVPIVPSPLNEGANCAFDGQRPQPAGEQIKRYDSCAAGLGCVQVPGGQEQCRALCALRVAGVCGGDRLCVVPTQVSAIGFCATPDGCDPVAQTGCEKAGLKGTACYVLGDTDHAGAFCLDPQLLGDSTGDEGQHCDRSVNCKAGLSCVTVLTAAACVPYCALPVADGGAQDGGPTRCGEMNGTCHAIAGYDGPAGRCY